LIEPTISLSENLLDFQIDYINPGEVILVSLYVLGPITLETEASGKGVTVVKIYEPGCEDSINIKRAGAEAVYGTSMNYFNEDLCSEEQGILTCELSFKSDFFEVGVGKDVEPGGLIPVPYIHSYSEEPDPLLE
jgi:hypothetical protein